MESARVRLLFTRWSVSQNSLVRFPIRLYFFLHKQHRQTVFKFTSWTRYSNIEVPSSIWKLTRTVSYFEKKKNFKHQKASTTNLQDSIQWVTGTIYLTISRWNIGYRCRFAYLLCTAFLNPTGKRQDEIRHFSISIHAFYFREKLFAESTTNLEATYPEQSVP